MRSRSWLNLVALVTVFLFGVPAMAADFPTRDLQGVIQWGAGGGTDGFSRAVTPNVEPFLGHEIVLVNKPGGTGAIATQYVASARADGYTLLYGAENPQLYGVLGLSDLSYDDFYPVNILARGQVVIIAGVDSPWKSLRDLVQDAQSRPGMIKMGSTGPGGVPYVVGKLMQTVTGFDVAAVPFQGDGPGITALLGGHIDFMPTVISASSEHIRAGRVKVLAVVDSVPLKFGDISIPPITENYPGFEKYVPWGPFFGVFCKKDVPAEVKAKLTEAFQKGAGSERFKDFVATKESVLMNINGDEAVQFLKKWQSVTAWLLHDAGATKVSPAELGIAKP
jgi:tripartite-type tricarboxylate transporter receptor subunit TctC